MSESTEARLKTFLIVHREERLNAEVLPRWLASFSQLCGVIMLEEARGRRWRRIKREARRVGWLRLLDVFAFRAYHRAFLAGRDTEWEEAAISRLCGRYPPPPEATPILRSESPNTAEAEAFQRDCAPDLTIARCKILLPERVFSIPRAGTYVMHPGICPEYRNAHGCFWALSRGDRDKVGMSLLRIDRGVDTGPIYGYFGCSYDEVNESHIVIQLRTVFDNLDLIRERLLAIFEGAAAPVNVEGRESAEWGQPWLTKYLAWKITARRRGETR
jgi:hypothetical protein